MPRILLIEDDAMIRRGLEIALARHGHEVTSAEDGEHGLARLDDGDVDVVVLDIMLPGMDGFEVCRRIRSASQVPVIMLTARGDSLDIVTGLELGADDYVVKPVQPSVLDARVRALLRRMTGDPDGVRTLGRLRIDTDALTVKVDGALISLTPTEMRLLLTLSNHPERVFSRELLLEEVWEQGYLGDSRLVDNGVMRLRSKIEEDPARPRYVQTVRGFGYRFGPL